MHGDTTIDDQGTVAGISRRDMLRKSAVVGGAGALMWAAPSITKYGSAAFGAEGTPFPGAVSWVIVWFRVGNEYHRVKYQGETGYTAECNATRNNVSANDSRCLDYFDTQEGKANDLTLNAACPPDVQVTNVDGDLSITTSGDTSIIGWVLHDGSCQKASDDKAFCRSPEHNYKSATDPTLVGPVVPTNGGNFIWTQCK